MAWRNAKSLDVLIGEIRAQDPNTTIWTIGDTAHQASWSDHNPNAAGVVCAADILGDAGLNLRWLADTIVATNPPALKYVIYQAQIWFPGYGWSAYTGEYHTHVHVSVGWGPDGQSTGPYDDTSPWGLTAPTKAQPSKEDDDDMKMILLQDQTGIALVYVHPMTGELVWTNAVTVEAVQGWQAAGVPLVSVPNIASHGRNAGEVAKEVLAALRAGGAGGVGASKYTLTGNLVAA